MQFSLIKNNIIFNIIECEEEKINELGLDFDLYIPKEKHHAKNVEYIHGDFYKIIDGVRYKYNLISKKYEIEA